MQGFRKVMVIRSLFIRGKMSCYIGAWPRGLVEHIVRGLFWEMRAAMTVMCQNFTGVRAARGH